jgi:hypothetical protein
MNPPPPLTPDSLVMLTGPCGTARFWYKREVNHHYYLEAEPGAVDIALGYGGCVAAYTDPRITAVEPVVDSKATRTIDGGAHETDYPHREQVAQRVPVDEKVPLQEQAHPHLAAVHEAGHEAGAPAQLELF